MEKIRVLIVEDDLEWIETLNEFLSREKDIYLVGHALNREDALLMAKNTEIDVILMDINIEEKYDGIYTAFEIFNVNKAKIIMLTSLEEKEAVIKSFSAGAFSFIPKKHFRKLPEAIRQAYNGFWPHEVLIQEFSRLKEREQLDCLTKAEKELYCLKQQGYSNSQIQKIMCKSEGTIKNQLNKLLKKLGAKTGKEAILRVRKKVLLFTDNNTDSKNKHY